MRTMAMIVGMLVQLANGAAATPTAGFVGRSGNDTIVNSSQPGGSVLIDGQNLVSGTVCAPPLPPHAWLRCVTVADDFFMMGLSL